MIDFWIFPLSTIWGAYQIQGIPVVSDGKSVPEYVCQQWIDEVLVIPSEEMPYPEELMEQLEKTEEIPSSRCFFTSSSFNSLLYCFLDIKICSSYDRFLDISIVYHMGSISNMMDQSI